MARPGRSRSKSWGTSTRLAGIASGPGPYGISTPGTIVRLYGYSENGDVRIIVFADRKRPEALEFERLLWQEHGKDGDPPHDKSILVHIDPQWIEPCDGNDA